MDTKNKSKINLTRFANGFTLLELVVVITIIGFLVMIVARVHSGEDDQIRFEETVRQMEEVQKAILGARGSYVNGIRQFSGYVSDLGVLPPFNGDGQPESLWSQGALPDWKYESISGTWMGWRGPYLESPRNNVLKDGWGNPFVFSLSNGEMTMESHGADGRDDLGGETGHDIDIETTIKKTEYLAPIAGRITGFSDGNQARVKVRVYFSEGGNETFYRLDGVDEHGNFRFVNGATAVKPDGTPVILDDNPIPQGLRSIWAWEDTNGNNEPDGGETQKRLVFTVEPTGNWIGDLKIQ
jgi:prepilin-type N-terminal cleavage/methylation domain-containing protein